MATARSKIVSLEVTPWYHCTTRCVRQAFLCGYDQKTNTDYSHRKKWLEDRILFLAKVFCIELGAYAIMSNHYHVVVKIDQDHANRISDKEVVTRWLRIYKGTPAARKYLDGNSLLDTELDQLKESIKSWRRELSNLSRFMAEINQKIAIRANREDGSKGKFWEARFNSQAVLDPDTLIRTLIYVDLNPVRAKTAPTPEKSEHTSIFRRLGSTGDNGLLNFHEGTGQPGSGFQTQQCLPICFKDYLALLDWTGKNLDASKRGSIRSHTPDIFERLGYSSDQWFKSVRSSNDRRQSALGSTEKIEGFCKFHGRSWIWTDKDHDVS